MPIIESRCVATEREASLDREDFRIMPIQKAFVIGSCHVVTESVKSVPIHFEARDLPQALLFPSTSSSQNFASHSLRLSHLRPSIPQHNTTNMAGSPSYSDAERVVFMLIFEHHEDLAWHEVTQVFNMVFNQKTRSRSSLVSAWNGRLNADQQEVWNRLRNEPQGGHDLATRQQWAETIDTAVEQLDRPPKKPQRPRTAQWNDDMRLVLYLLIKDTSVGASERIKIFNALFRDLLAGQRVAPLTKEALRAQWGLRNRMRRNNGEAQQAESEKTAVAQTWQRIIDGPQTEEEQAIVAHWQEAIKEQREKPQEDEGEVDAEQAVEEEAHEHEPQGNWGKPSFDVHEDVGDWRYRSWNDWNRARTKLGNKLPGMWECPIAENVQRLREQIKRDKRPDTWTQGINIYPGLETKQWKLVGPTHQQRGHDESVLKPTHSKDPRGGVPATAVGESGSDLIISDDEEVAEESDEEDDTQESGPEDGGPKAKKRRIENITPHQRSLLMREEINNHLLPSDPEAAAEIRQLFDDYDRSTLFHAELHRSNPERTAVHRQLLDELDQALANIAADGAKERHASRKRKRSS